jgi:hypothetical protein
MKLIWYCLQISVGLWSKGTFPNPSTSRGSAEKLVRREREREREENDDEIAAKVCFPLIINYFSGESFTNSVV